MRKRLLWACFILIGLLGAGALAAFLEPTRIVRGLLAGEPIYRGRPASFWREVLRECGRNNSIPAATSRQFGDTQAALPVLRECVRDPDRNVRWPAIALIGVSRLRTQPALDLLIAALDDEDEEVRLKAVGGLARWGPMARPAMPALAARLQDPEAQVALAADVAHWRIDVDAAAAATGWHTFASADYGFSVKLPGQPERQEKQLPGKPTIAHVFRAWHRAGPHQSPTLYMVVVSDYPAAMLEGATEEDKSRALKESAPFLTGGKVLEEKEVLLGDHHGRDILLGFADEGRISSRHFWVGPRLYGVMVIYKPEFLNAPAAAYFQDSFRLEKKGTRDELVPEGTVHRVERRE